ncbi:hypothetical protein LY78DRAFT_651224 [Colletotrichum sublineola]|nr:hypothetical protein LY78DRAFT_651224 [Colletotrichum sublineola]
MTASVGRVLPAVIGSLSQLGSVLGGGCATGQDFLPASHFCTVSPVSLCLTIRVPTRVPKLLSWYLCPQEMSSVAQLRGHRLF